MKKIKILIKIFIELLRDPKKLKLVIKSSENDYKNLVIKNYNIKQLPTVDILTLFGEFEEVIENYTYLEGTSNIMDIVLLKKLAYKFDSCNFLEIGCWRGESLFNVAKVAKNCVSISLSKNELRSMNLSDNFIMLNHFFSKNLVNLRKIEHNSLSYEFNKINEKFDLIFVDGNHSYNGVFSDSKNVYNLLRNDESIIVWHDYGKSTEKVRYEVLAGILDGIPKNEHKYLYHVSNTVCSIFYKKEFNSTYYTKFPSIPNKIFTINLKAKII